MCKAKIEIVPPVSNKNYKGPDRRYYQHYFVGNDNRLDISSSAAYYKKAADKKKAATPDDAGFVPGLIFDTKF